MHSGGETKSELITESSPTYAILKKLKLEVGENSNVIRKVLFFCSITWVPLLIITLIEGNALNKNIQLPFLIDYVIYTRFLISLPVIFVAEKFIRFETSNAVSHFVNSGIITGDNEKLYADLVSKYSRLLNSKIIEQFLLVATYVQLFVLRAVTDSSVDESSWKYLSDGSATAAWYYFAYVSAPILQFLILRMLWRFIMWGWFLFKVSRMDLNLTPINPDKSGGLAFLGVAQVSFGILGFAQGANYSSEIAQRIILGGASVEDFKFPVLIAIILVVQIYMSPLFFFSRKLIKLKLKGLIEYGVLANKYTSSFDNKWIRGGAGNEELLGTGDIQSLNDLIGSYEQIQESRFVPFNLRNFITMALMIAVPFFPLVLLKIPLSEVLKGLAGFIL
jgi:hypothetical protein